MTLRWLLANLHLLALPLGVAAIWTRGSALRALPSPEALRRAFHADAAWGASALVWIATGLLRAFAGFEKGSAYYLQSHVFWTKMGLLALVLVLEIGPMVALIQWRIRHARGEAIDFARAGSFATISRVQTLLIVAMVLAATAMARGLGL